MKSVIYQEELDKNNGAWALTENALDKALQLDMSIDALLMHKNDYHKDLWVIKDELEIIGMRLRKLSQIYMMIENDVYLVKTYHKDES